MRHRTPLLLAGLFLIAAGAAGTFMVVSAEGPAEVPAAVVASEASLADPIDVDRPGVPIPLDWAEPILAEPRIVNKIPRVVAEQFSPRPDYFLTVRGDSMNRMGLRDGDIVAVRAAPEASNGEIVVARFGDEVTLKQFQRLDERHIELRPHSTNPEHQTMHIDLAKHILHIDGVVVGHIRTKSSVEAAQERLETGAHI